MKVTVFSEVQQLLRYLFLHVGLALKPNATQKNGHSIPKREVADSIFGTDHKILQNTSDEQI